MLPADLLIVLHAHLPYVRHPEHAVSVEEHWLFDAMVDCYLPLLHLFHRLNSERVPFPLALSVSPTLLEMLGDSFLRERFSRYLDDRIELCRREEHRLKNTPAFHPAIRMYLKRFRQLHRLWHVEFGRDLTTALRSVAGGDGLELLTTGATHGFLPYLRTNAGAVHAQVGIGLKVFERAFHQRTTGFWLPECGYEPALGPVLEGAGIAYTFLDGHGVLFGEPAPAGGLCEPVRVPGGLVAFPRHTGLSGQVWATGGYPGDPAYREYYRDIGFDLELEQLIPQMHPDGIRLPTGLKYYRITGAEGEKEAYDPLLARRRVVDHAHHFVEAIRDTARRVPVFASGSPVITCAFDAELFGHWWFEGIDWLETVFRLLAGSDSGIRARTPSQVIGERSTRLMESAPASSSWGEGGFGGVWLDRSTDWIWGALHEAGEAFGCRLTDTKYGVGSGTLERAAREYLLAQSSDWPFMISRRRTAAYAQRRVEEHLNRFWESIRNGKAVAANPTGAGTYLFRHIPCIPFFRSEDCRRDTV